MSLIHIANMAWAVVPALEAALTHRPQNVVDDERAATRELYGYVAAQAGSLTRRPRDVVLPSLGCGNARLKAEFAGCPPIPHTG